MASPRYRFGWFDVVRLLILLIPVGLLSLSHLEVIDDAYISFRYAHNVGSGDGYVYNVGERVEGTTNLLWTLAMATPDALDLPVSAAAVVVGVFLGVIALVFTDLTLRSLHVSAAAELLALAALALYPEFWLTAANGLEGGLVAALLAVTVFCTLTGRPGAAGFAAGLAFATRPDTALVGPLCAVAAVVGVSGPADSWRRVDGPRLVKCLAPWFAIVVAITAWRLWYFHAVLPNSIGAKSALTLRAPWSERRYWIEHGVVAGGRYWLGFVVAAAPLALGAAVATVVVRTKVTLLCVAIAAVQVPVVLANGGDWMPHHRLLAVYAPVLAVVLGTVCDQLAPTLRRSYPLLSAACAVALLGVMLPSGQWDRDVDLRLSPTEPCWQRIAAAVAPAVRSGDRLAPEAIGVFGYRLSDTYVHDFLGLTDATIAKNGTVFIPQYGKAFPPYTVDTIRPELIIVHSGFGHLSYFSQLTAGRLDSAYETYDLSEPPECSDRNFMVSIRRDAVARYLPAFASFSPRLVNVPSG